MKISFSPPDIGEDEIRLVTEVLRTGWITTGPKTKLLEKKIGDYCHTGQAVCLSSQTACAEMTLRILRVGPEQGSELRDGQFGDRLACVLGE